MSILINFPHDWLIFADDQKLLEFLVEEIKLEDENTKQQNLPKIKDFAISHKESEVTLTKNIGSEK